MDSALEKVLDATKEVFVGDDGASEHQDGRSQPNLPPSIGPIVTEVVVTDGDESDANVFSDAASAGSRENPRIHRKAGASASPSITQPPISLPTNLSASTEISRKLRLDAREQHKLQMEVEGFHSRALPEAVVETPEFQRQALNEMQQAIDENLDPYDKQAYLKGVTLGSHVQREDLRLRYLRTDVWNPLAAAKRFVSHLQMLQDYFGDVALSRELKLSDLGKEELKFVKKGTVQLLPSRDRAGRRVVCFVGDWGAGISTYTNVSQIRKR
jgi:hypothetical protein